MTTPTRRRPPLAEGRRPPLLPLISVELRRDPALSDEDVRARFLLCYAIILEAAARAAATPEGGVPQ